MRRAPVVKDFIGKPAPPGYVAGIGRGATGFTTRSDIGPARDIKSMPHPSTSGTQSNQQIKPRSQQQNDADEDEDEYLNESNYDEFTGYGGSLVSKDPYEEDDEEADKIYEQVDKHMDERGKALREARTRQQIETYREKRPKIQQQFSDLKSGLKQMTEEDWMKIPEVGDARNRKQRVARQEKYTPVPDSLLAHQAKLASGGDKLVYIDPKAVTDNASDDDEADDNDPKGVQANSLSLQTITSDNDRQTLNIGEMSDFRSSYMSMKLSRTSANSNISQNEGAMQPNSIAQNPQDYLTNLQSTIPNQITDEATLAEYRKQFSALRKSNPTFENAWIASVRLEEAAGKLKAARSLILAACEQCPKSADLWCEAVRLHPPDTARTLMINALKENPRSIKLWIKAADLEKSDEARRRVYAKAREILPKSVILWKKSVELERPEMARTILKEAVECCPEAVELWIALARLLPYEEAKRALVTASEKNPTDRSIWITAAKLEEAAGNKSIVSSIIKLSIEKLCEKGVEIKRDEWLREAVDAERAGFSTTCRAIIRRLIGWNMANKEPDEKLKIWMEDIRSFVAANSINCTRAVYSAIVQDRHFSKLEHVWISYIDFERKYQISNRDGELSLERPKTGAEIKVETSTVAGSGEDDIVCDLLKQAVQKDHCPKSERLWLALAKQRQRVSLDESRQILSDALDMNPDSERIVLAAVELECDTGNHKEARRILADACMSAKTAQLVMRAAKLEWSQRNLDEAVRMLQAGANEYRNEAEFYLALGQIEEERGSDELAKEHYANGLKFNPTSVQLWISLANLEERTGSVAKARSRLEMARLRNPKVARLWLESALLEKRALLSKARGAGSTSGGARFDVVQSILAKGIRECRDCADVEMLQAELNAISKRKLVQSAT